MPSLTVSARRFALASTVLLLLSFLGHTSALVRAPRADPDTTLVSGVDYVAGEVVVEFTEFYMPPLDSMPLSLAQFGIDSGVPTV